MFADQQLALANLRFLARGGQSPAYYDLLEERLSALAQGWKTLPLSESQCLILAAYRTRLLFELAYLRSVAALKG